MPRDGPDCSSAKIAKLLRLALIADQEGEARAALAALRRALASAGLDPHYIADAFERGTSQVAPSIYPADAQGDDRSAVWWCWHHRDRLTPKESDFIAALTRWRGPISARQREWLHGIVDRLEAA